jgi:hypothetical protein
MQGQLFTTDFLMRGVQETGAWRSLSDFQLDTFISQLKAHYAPFSAQSALNEGQTEDELIEPVIDLLGWRIDYQIATPGIAAKAQSASVYKEQRFSDHASLIVDYDYTL